MQKSNGQESAPEAYQATSWQFYLNMAFYIVQRIEEGGEEKEKEQENRKSKGQFPERDPDSDVINLLI